MGHKLIFLISLTGIAAGIPLTEPAQAVTLDNHEVQYTVQLVPVPPRSEVNTVNPPPVYLPVQQQPHVYIPPSKAKKQPPSHGYPTQHYTTLNKIDTSGSQHLPSPTLQQPFPFGQATAEIPIQQPLQVPNQQPLQIPSQHPLPTSRPVVQESTQPTTHHPFLLQPLPVYQTIPSLQQQPHQIPSQQSPVYQTFSPLQQQPLQIPSQQSPVYQTLPPHQQPEEAVHQVVHNPPPAPVPGSTSAYVATLSYGPGHPVVVYGCYIPGRHYPPVTTSSSYHVKGSNGYHCAVTYHHSGHYHLIHTINNVQSGTVNYQKELQNNPEKLPELSAEDFYDKK